jgi:hypothetical protein
MTVTTCGGNAECQPRHCSECPEAELLHYVRRNFSRRLFDGSAGCETFCDTEWPRYLLGSSMCMCTMNCVCIVVPLHMNAAQNDHVL